MSHDVHQVRSFEHPGEGRRRAKSTPKGRQVDPQAAEEIAVLLGDRPRRRDLLIEHLHLIQDKYHQISAAHLAALAEEMKAKWSANKPKLKACRKEVKAKGLAGDDRWFYIEDCMAKT